MIRLINTTTQIPVDKTIEDSLFSVAKANFVDAVKNQRHDSAHIDVNFVNQDDLDLERARINKIENIELENDESLPNIPDMDLLGVYFPHHPDYHHPIIKVSPEKVMSACLTLKANLLIPMPLEELFPTILNAVVIHELAHSLMDKDSPHSECATPWKWLADRLEKDKQYEFKNHHCYNHAIEMPPKLQQMRHVVEESLANAFVLKQDFSAIQLKVLRQFIESQPAAYKASLHWKGDITKLFEVAASWSHFKDDGFHSRWHSIYLEHGVKSPLEVLVDRLIVVVKPGEVYAAIGQFDFQQNFYRHLLSRLPAWQKEFQNNKSQWNEFLNGTFGVLDTIVHTNSSDGVITNKHFSYLEQWALNGSAEAIGKLNKIRSDECKARKDYKQAIKFQLLRKANLPNINHNEYWHKIHAAEIRKSIADLTELATNTKLIKAITGLETKIANGAFQDYLNNNPPENRISWRGAGLIVTSNKKLKGYEGDVVLVTPHADEVSWYLSEIKMIVYRQGRIDFSTKGSFFIDLAKSVADLPKGSKEKLIFDTLMAKTRNILIQPK